MGAAVPPPPLAPPRLPRQVVHRLTLKRECPTVLTLLKALPKQVELQEPTFKEIVVLYRWGCIAASLIRGALQ